MKRYFLKFIFSHLILASIIFFALDKIYASKLKILSDKNLNLIKRESLLERVLNGTRDFIRYNCKSISRIGGNRDYVRKTNDKLWRIDE